MEISNKTLAWLVVAVIVVSLAGTIISLQKINDSGFTGFASSNKSGNASVTISQTTTLNFAVNALNFGSGSVTAGPTHYGCDISNFNSTTIVQNGSYGGCIGFNTATAANGWLQIENAGNTNMNVSLNFSGVASTIIQTLNSANAPAPQLYWKAANNGTELGSCANISSTNWTQWNNVSGTGLYWICLGNTGLQPGDTTDSMTIGINMTIPWDAPTGTKTLWIMASGSNQGG